MIDRWKSYCGGSALLAWLTLGEAGVWIIITLLSLAGRILHFDVPISEWLTLPSAFSLFLTRPWTLITYMCVHFEVLHMLFNVLWLYWFGQIMLNTLSDRHLAFAFFGGGIAGGIMFLISAALGYGSGWLCGCSAAVIAVMCATALILPDHTINLFLIGEVRLKWIAAACCILTFLGGGGNQAAHIGGAILGISYGIMLRNSIDPSSWMAGLLSKHRENRKPYQTKRKPERMVRMLKDRQSDMQRLDEILDKIKLSGYGSLSPKERNELNELSQRLKR